MLKDNPIGPLVAPLLEGHAVNVLGLLGSGHIAGVDLNDVIAALPLGFQDGKG